MYVFIAEIEISIAVCLDTFKTLSFESTTPGASSSTKIIQPDSHAVPVQETPLSLEQILTFLLRVTAALRARLIEPTRSLFAMDKRLS